MILNIEQQFPETLPEFILVVLRLKQSLFKNLTFTLKLLKYILNKQRSD